MCVLSLVILNTLNPNRVTKDYKSSKFLSVVSKGWQRPCKMQHHFLRLWHLHIYFSWHCFMLWSKELSRRMPSSVWFRRLDLLTRQTSGDRGGRRGEIVTMSTWICRKTVRADFGAMGDRRLSKRPRLLDDSLNSWRGQFRVRVAEVHGWRQEETSRSANRMVMTA